MTLTGLKKYVKLGLRGLEEAAGMAREVPPLLAPFPRMQPLFTAFAETLPRPRT